jgi:hypothetical protein
MYTSSYITYSNNPGVWPPTSEMMPPVIALGSMMPLDAHGNPIH